MKKNIIAIIPARAGSKRIINKNVVDIAGKPMIVWTIEAALKSEIFSDVLVSTDEEDIANLSKRSGASAPFLRDPKDADDYTPVSVATTNALRQMEEYKSTEYDIVVQLMPNCPCRTSSNIVDACNNFLATNTNFQISVFKFGWMNPWWAMTVNKNTNIPTRLFPEAFNKRSQDLEQLYCPSGAIWIASVDALKSQKTFYGEGYTVYPMDWRQAVDIDDNEDLEMAHIIARF